MRLHIVTYFTAEQLLRVHSIRGFVCFMWLLGKHGSGWSWGFQSVEVVSVRAEWSNICSSPPSLWSWRSGEELERARTIRTPHHHGKHLTAGCSRSHACVLTGGVTDPPQTDGRPSTHLKLQQNRMSQGQEEKTAGVKLSNHKGVLCSKEKSSVFRILKEIKEKNQLEKKWKGFSDPGDLE